MRRQRGPRFITSPKLFGHLPLEIPLPTGERIPSQRALTITRAVLAQVIPSLKDLHGAAHVTIYSLEISFSFFMKVRVSDTPPLRLPAPKRRVHPKS